MRTTQTATDDAGFNDSSSIVTPSPRGELLQGGGADEALFWLRAALGMVAPRDPVTRRLGERRYRLDLLAELCERETFLLLASWLGSDAVPSMKAKQDYADDIRLWHCVASELAGHERFFLGAISPEIVETWTKLQKARKVSPRTTNRRLSTLTSFTKYAAWKKKDITIISPVSKYDRPHVDPNDETTATPILEVNELQAVLSAATTARQALTVALIYTLAGRVSEFCSAQLTDLKVGGGLRRLDLQRKGGKGRAWVIPEDLWALAEVALAGRESGPLLVDDNGAPMDRHAVDRLLTKLGKLAGVLPGRELTPHVLRASRLTHMRDEGVQVEEIQEYADHATIQTTMRYIRMRDATKRKARHAESATRIYRHVTERFSRPETREES